MAPSARHRPATAGGHPVLDVRHLVKRFPLRRRGFGERGHVTAVDDCSFQVDAGETFALVGESGCGKTTIAHMILRLVEPTAGEILFDGRNLDTLSGAELHRFRHSVQAVFQDPYSSLNPRQRIADTIAEPLDIHERLTRHERQRRIDELLEQVGLDSGHARAYPHELSGGQRQRVAIARAISIRPRLIVLDEPVSALDVSIRAQILNLLSDLQRELGLAYLFISHDLAIVEHLSHRVGVMYLGRLLEIAAVDELFAAPLSPYTRALIAAVQVPDPTMRSAAAAIAEEAGAPGASADGCRFQPRCAMAQDECRRTEPTLTEHGAAHWVACHFADRSSGQVRSGQVQNPAQRTTSSGDS